MKWTKAKPQLEGHYWVKATTPSNRIREFVAHVYRMNKLDELPSLVFWDGENFRVTADCFLEWSDGPIQKPDGAA